MKCNENHHGEYFKPERSSDPSDSDESNFDDRDGKPGQTKDRNHCQRTIIQQCISWRGRDFGLDGYLENSSYALFELLEQSSSRSVSDANDGKRSQREHRSKLRIVRPLNELLARAAYYVEVSG